VLNSLSDVGSLSCDVYELFFPGPQKLGTWGTLIFATMSYPGLWPPASKGFLDEHHKLNSVKHLRIGWSSMSRKGIYTTATFLMIGCLFTLFIVPAFYNSKLYEPLSVLLVLGIFFIYGCRFVTYLKSRREKKLAPDIKRPQSRRWISLLIFGIAFSCAFELFSDLYSRHLPIFQDAKLALITSSICQSELGEFIEIGWPIKAELKWSAESEYAALEIPVSGNRAKGVLYVTGTKVNGVWKAEEMSLIISGSSQRQSIMSSTF